MDQDRPVRVGYYPSSLLIKAGAAAQTLAPAGVHDGRALLLETRVLVWKAGAEALAGGHAGDQAVVWMEDAALVVVVGMRGQAQDLGHGETHVVCFVLVYRLGLNGWSCEKRKSKRKAVNIREVLTGEQYALRRNKNRKNMSRLSSYL